MKILCASLVSCLCGCATPWMLTGVGVGSVAVNEATGRTVTDHAVSAVNKQDCRIVRAFKSEEICQTDGTGQLKVIGTGVIPSTIQEIESKYR